MRLKSILLLLLAAAAANAERHELGLLLGASKPTSRSLDNSTASLSVGTTFYANYGIRLTGSSKAALFLEVPFLAAPGHRVSSTNQALTRDIATLYVTPGLRLKFWPDRRIAPYVAAGGGYALFEHSTLRLDGKPNSAARTISSAAFDFGAGADVRLWRFVSVRGEIRDLLSGNPDFNAPLRGSTQHNVVVAGGFALHW